MVPPLSLVQAMAQAILPTGVAVAIRDAHGDVSQLFAEERAAVLRAVPSRQAEFAAGRQAARQALLHLGQGPIGLPVAESRGPGWPAGFTGSISHCRGAVIAIAARLTPERGPVGIDIEEATALEVDLWGSICTPSELAWLDDQPDAGRRVKVIFSIKEAVYKAQYPITQTMLDFHDVEVIALEPSGSFEVAIATDALKKVTGRFRASDQFIVAFASAGNAAP
ncbi:MAG: 4'-phosphopantetheinyl transferase superfamily protein [Candidatus Devosia phytovorans]|uniref:Enterobactin synthase component D n=1 Tax=Candidatus Devosia phytovorans TaxID=3121372 RepID=A0AAJ5VUI9_9HYPH|nr:4'-phosphopantetheinyl transferase superfamily protein [Devosia sp.]WEK03723.1 MAG: 4'-phosphopantetheinyl transferase superfamily protein [Devosia sp.]